MLGQFIIEEVLQKDVTSVVDVGCGKGYLSIDIAEKLIKAGGEGEFTLIDG